MLRCVKLEHLPTGLVFPEKLSDRISYDVDARELRFDGFMSKTDFDKLVCLHNDIEYQRALERLFQICTFNGEQDSASSLGTKILVVASATAALAAVGVAVFIIVR